ncbi:hypothetical protein MPSEU_000208600 [Mayamaea pseudoterrestris]|nr:hypothetical protein MPSEU_000208600 [Mayamaea pseudoterrestris]
MKGMVPDEANAIEYIKDDGHYLKAHVDDRKLAEEPIANISLAGDCVMTFSNIAANRNNAVSEYRVLLKRRCLQIMTGKARYDFTHAIHHADLLSPRRVSVTMRRATAPPSMQQSTPMVASESSISWWQKPKLLSAVDVGRQSSQPLPGLYLIENFLSQEEELLILSDLDQSNAQQAWVREKHTGSHFEKRFGIDHDLWSKHLRPPVHPMPRWFHGIVSSKLQQVAFLLQNCVPNEMNVIDYRSSRGDHLKAHMDDRVKYKEPIVNLSLAGDCYMVFAKERDASVAKKILLKRRTLQVLTGKARYEWTHGIEASDILSDRRVSVTMRETVGTA